THELHVGTVREMFIMLDFLTEPQPVGVFEICHEHAAMRVPHRGDGDGHVAAICSEGKPEYGRCHADCLKGDPGSLQNRGSHAHPEGPLPFPRIPWLECSQPGDCFNFQDALLAFPLEQKCSRATDA